MKENVIKEKSFSFSLDIINLYKELATQKEFIISKQLLRSGTSTCLLQAGRRKYSPCQIALYAILFYIIDSNSTCPMKSKIFHLYLTG